MKVFILLGQMDYEGSTVLEVYADKAKAESVRAAVMQHIDARPAYPFIALTFMSEDSTPERQKQAEAADQQHEAAITAWEALAPIPGWAWYDRLRILEKDVIEQ